MSCVPILLLPMILPIPSELPVPATVGADNPGGGVNGVNVDTRNLMTSYLKSFVKVIRQDGFVIKCSNPLARPTFFLINLIRSKPF